MELSKYLNETVIQSLKKSIQENEFPGIDFTQAMQFILSNGIFPESNLPLSSFLKLSDWLKDTSNHLLFFSATELKNKTGLVIEKALQGHTVQIIKHGRPILEIRGIE